MAQILSHVPRRLALEKIGDDESTDDKEDVDADVAALKPGNRRVYQDDERHGDRPESLDIGTKDGMGRQRTIRRHRSETALFE